MPGSEVTPETCMKRKWNQLQTNNALWETTYIFGNHLQILETALKIRCECARNWEPTYGTRLQAQFPEPGSPKRLRMQNVYIKQTPWPGNSQPPGNNVRAAKFVKGIANTPTKTNPPCKWDGPFLLFFYSSYGTAQTSPPEDRIFKTG